MQSLESIKGIIYEFDESTLNKDITEVLEDRYGEWDLMTSLADLHDPFLLRDMDKAVARLQKAHEKGERIAIFWDYDVDWVTSTSILMHFFKKVWFQATYRLPHRVEDWYGLKSYFIDELAEKGVTLVVTVDCWTRDVEVVNHAKTLGVDIIITDHHAMPEEIPDKAVALINPKREDCEYPFKFLAGAWVAFKLMDALASKFLAPDEHKRYIEETVDICAIWTVADCMTIVWENRVIVSEGLKRLKNSRSKGIRAIIEDKINDDLDADIFGFQIWPRLNAAWRLDTPYKAVNLILNQEDSVFETLADIESLNDRRKEMTTAFVEDALSQIDETENVIFYHSDKIEHWIIWIVAWRITEKFHRPCIVLKDEGEKLVGSCRAPEYFHMVELLEKCRDLLMHFWGHKQAAWFSVSKGDFEAFKSRVKELLEAEDFTLNKKVVHVDKEITLDEIWFKLISRINKYKPFWIGNEKPRLIARDIIYDKVEYLGKDNKHIKFTTKHGFKIFAFFMWEYFHEIKEKKTVSLVFDVSEDSWLGRKNIMLKVIDVI